jgi:hypothetical protein
VGLSCWLGSLGPCGLVTLVKCGLGSLVVGLCGLFRLYCVVSLALAVLVSLEAPCSYQLKFVKG